MKLKLCLQPHNLEVGGLEQFFGNFPGAGSNRSIGRKSGSGQFASTVPVVQASPIQLHSEHSQRGKLMLQHNSVTCILRFRYWTWASCIKD